MEEEGGGFNIVKEQKQQQQTEGVAHRGNLCTGKLSGNLISPLTTFHPSRWDGNSQPGSQSVSFLGCIEEQNYKLLKLVNSVCVMGKGNGNTHCSLSFVPLLL